jgi:glycosyltransferase involved in cell wall biosynthesis
VQFGDIRFAADLVPLSILRLSGIRLADVCHNVVPFDTTGSPDVLRRSRRTANIFRKIYRCFSLIFVHSEVNKQLFIETYGRPAQIEVIPHGNESIFRTSSDIVTPAVADRFAISEGSPVVLFFGNLSKYKGIEDLIASFRQVVSAMPDARLIIAGYPNPDVDVKELEKLISHLDLGESVVLYPHYIPMEEVSGFFELARVVALPYRMIFQSGALQVAYSFGKPVVATAVGGLNEAVEDGSTGFLVPPGDHPSLADALIKILRDEPLAKRMGERAKLLSDTKYSWDNVARIAAAAYGGVCKVAQN